jgi:DNA modification methylase
VRLPKRTDGHASAPIAASGNSFGAGRGSTDLRDATGSLFPTSTVTAVRGRQQGQLSLSPKRPLDEQAGLGDVFPYYAGFSYDWAREQIAAFDLEAAATVLDPWNGSGTTVLAAQSAGLRSIGIDLSPVACTVAQLKTQGLGAVVSAVAPPTKSLAVGDDEPLLAWFAPKTASRIRAWMQCGDTAPSGLSALLVTVSLFRVVRALTKQFEGSNPTWVRVSKDDAERVDLGDAAIDELVVAHQLSVGTRLGAYESPSGRCSIAIATASRLPLAKASVDAIITSPPYLTRIDYAIAYSRELAVLGTAVGRDRRRTSRSLRAQLMGTTLIRQNVPGHKHNSPLALELLARVQEHPSKDSAGYYLKQIRQYLGDLTECLDELSRVAKSGAPMVLVVQDSYYKDIPIPLAKICIEECEARGWALARRPKKYNVKRYLTQLNTAARVYAKGDVAESVLSLRRT